MENECVDNPVSFLRNVPRETLRNFFLLRITVIKFCLTLNLFVLLLIYLNQNREMFHVEHFSIFFSVAICG